MIVPPKLSGDAPANDGCPVTLHSGCPQVAALSGAALHAGGDLYPRGAAMGESGAGFVEQACFGEVFATVAAGSVGSNDAPFARRGSVEDGDRLTAEKDCREACGRSGGVGCGTVERGPYVFGGHLAVRVCHVRFRYPWRSDGAGPAGVGSIHGSAENPQPVAGRAVRTADVAHRQLVYGRIERSPSGSDGFLERGSGCIQYPRLYLARGSNQLVAGVHRYLTILRHHLHFQFQRRRLAQGHFRRSVDESCEATTRVAAVP